MKNILLFICLFFLGIYQAQEYHEQDKEGLRKFLSQPSATPGKMNWQQIGLTAYDLANWYNNENWVKKIPISNGYPQRGLIWNSGDRLGKNKRINYLILYGTNDKTPIYGGYLDCSYFKELTLIFMWNNKLTDINLTENTKLIDLYIGNNQISSLNLSNNNQLVRLSTYLNKNIQNLDLKDKVYLTYLDCGDNNLTKLNVSNNKLLKELYCYNNNITELNVQENPNLINLGCGNNQISQLNTSNNKLLKNLFCYYNKLTELDLTANPNLTLLYCWNNQLSTVDISKNSLLNTFWGHNNQLTKLNVTQNPNLVYLSFEKNQVSSIDLSKNKKLFRIFCSNNKLTELNVKENPDLAIISFWNNQISSIDVSRNKKLEELVTSNNNLKELDLSQNNSLKSLRLQNNYFLFSKMPSKIYETFLYQPQKIIQGGEIEVDNEINLSSEYSIKENLTSFQWYKNNQPIQLYNPSNGIFIADKQYIGDSLVCKMNNKSFPDLTLEYKILITKIETKPVLKDHIRLETSVAHQYNISKNINFNLYVHTNAPEKVRIGIFDSNNNQTLISRIDADRNGFNYTCRIPLQVRLRLYTIQPYIEENGIITIIQRKNHTPLIDKLPLRVINNIRSLAETNTEGYVNKNISLLFPEPQKRDMLIANINEVFRVVIPSDISENINIGLFDLDENLIENITVERLTNNVYACKISGLVLEDEGMIIPYTTTGNKIKTLKRETKSYWMDRLPLKIYDPLFSRKTNEYEFSINKKHELIKIYPNPTADRIQVKTEEKILKIELYNLTGQLLQKTENTRELSLEGFSSGIYKLNIQTKKGISSHKIRKK